MNPVLRFLDRRFVACLRAAVEALYPPSDNGAPDGTATDLARRTEAHIRSLPRTVRRQVQAMFIAIELLSPVMSPGGGWFSHRSPARRLADVTRWRGSDWSAIRLLSTGLHAQLQMLYLSHPAVSAFLGEYKPNPHPEDSYPMAIRAMPEAPYDPAAP